ncbi:MAG: 16S rRNA (cytosine(1402)-N(4))-methyltransferase RsmH [Acidimicrobiales bacterium]
MTRERPAAKSHGVAVKPGLYHEAVMVPEVVDLLAPSAPGVIVDATVGAGGHAAALLEASSSRVLVGIDRDEAAVREAKARLARFGDRAVVAHGRFDELVGLVGELRPGRPVTAILFDLGVSSHQFDEASRGFSYRYDAPLDMRMDRSRGPTAADILNRWPEDELCRLFSANGEQRFAARIARRVVANRPITSTGQLSELVRGALPAAGRRRGGHPAKRVFQAVRLAVNEELELLVAGLDQALRLIAPGGRIAVLSYHSGEDRIVKGAFAMGASGWCECPAGLPCVCGAVPALRLIHRGARKAGEAEIATNPRAASARLRAVERTDAVLRRPAGSRGGAPRGDS